MGWKGGEEKRHTFFFSCRLSPLNVGGDFTYPFNRHLPSYFLMFNVKRTMTRKLDARGSGFAYKLSIRVLGCLCLEAESVHSTRGSVFRPSLLFARGSGWDPGKSSLCRPSDGLHRLRGKRLSGAGFFGVQTQDFRRSLCPSLSPPPVSPWTLPTSPFCVLYAPRTLRAEGQYRRQ